MSKELRDKVFTKIDNMSSLCSEAKKEVKELMTVALGLPAEEPAPGIGAVVDLGTRGNLDCLRILSSDKTGKIILTNFYGGIDNTFPSLSKARENIYFEGEPEKYYKFVAKDLMEYLKQKGITNG